ARIGRVHALVCTATVTPTPASARESSSSTSTYERKSAPPPPCSSGMQTPSSPTSASRSSSFRGKRWSRSHCAACGSISSRPKSRASAWISRCSAVSSNCTRGRLCLRLRLQLVPHAEAGLDEGVLRGDTVDLLPQPPHEHVDRAVAVRLATPPHLLQQLVTRDHAAPVERERVQQLELGGRQLDARAVDVCLHLARVDAELLDLDRLAPPLLRRTNAAARSRPDPRHELSHRERLHQVVVRADLERVHAV